MRQIPLYFSKQSEIHQSVLLKNEKKTNKYDVYCFGLCLLEMISSDVSVPHAFKYLCKLINQGYKDLILSKIEDQGLRDILEISLHENPNNRCSVEELKNHQFFCKYPSDHMQIQLKPDFTSLVQKVYNECHNSSGHHTTEQNTPNKSMFSSDRTFISPNASTIHEGTEEKTHSSHMQGLLGQFNGLEYTSSSQEGDRNLVLNESVMS